jgi:hypothetical protein
VIAQSSKLKAQRGEFIADSSWLIAYCSWLGSVYLVIELIELMNLLGLFLSVAVLPGCG